MNLRTLELEFLGGPPFTPSYPKNKLFVLPGVSDRTIFAFYADTSGGKIKVFSYDLIDMFWQEHTPQDLKDESGYIHHSCSDGDHLVYIGVQSAKPGELYCYDALNDSWDTLSAEDLRGVDCIWDNKLFASVLYPINVGATEEERMSRNDTIRYLDLSDMTWKDFHVRLPKPRCGWIYYTSRAWLMNIKGTLYCLITGADNTIHGQQYEQRGMLFKFDADRSKWLPIDIHPQVSRYLASQSPSYTFSDTHLYVGHLQAGGQYVWEHPRDLIEIPLAVLEEA